MTAGAHDAVTLGCYALGVLDARERHGVEQHLSWCGQCRAQVTDFSRVRAVLDAIPREALIEELRPSTEKPSELVLQRALRQVRSEGATRGIPTPRASPPAEVVVEEEQSAPGQHRRSRKSAYLVAAAVVAAMGLGAGAVVWTTGSSEPPLAEHQNVQEVGSTQRLETKDSKTGVAIKADITNMKGWVKVQVQVAGMPAGQNCQLVVVSKDGSRENIKGWVSTEKSRTEGWTGGGNSSVLPSEFAGVSIEGEDGKRWVTVQV
jgi:hypothetical protein